MREVIQESPEEIKRNIDETRSALKGKLQYLSDQARHGLSSVKKSCDIPHQIGRHPWLALSGAVGAGWIIGRQLKKSNSNSPRSGAGLVSQFKDELVEIRRLAIASALGTVSGVLRKSIANSLRPQRNRTEEGRREEFRSTGRFSEDSPNGYNRSNRIIDYSDRL